MTTDHLAQLQALTGHLPANGVECELTTVPSSVRGEDDRDALRVFAQRCPVSKMPLRGVLVVAKGDHFWWGYRATHPTSDPSGAAIAISATVRGQEAARDTPEGGTGTTR
ncbi:hypothetical protein [Actinomadura sp. NEAU-AAG7]|uniref:hypothetical protein n=1 Tax=Actinomadura sp. NEAU-AAG7 TaxID=2839640 RepID=UPI001BE42B06|nr:hypothetical protein [Actinomadura sp. NEAU-AAG7]MBT2213449.1 hypothetical protein [Actinomadura sp. NEAU-AAG7]